MNTKLIQQLKEAGYPFPKVGCHECNEGRVCVSLDNGETIYEPTLEELIEACGCDMEIVLWSEGKTIVKRVNWDISDKFIEGSTYKEAVALLYLAINKS